MYVAQNHQNRGDHFDEIRSFRLQGRGLSVLIDRQALVMLAYIEVKT